MLSRARLLPAHIIREHMPLQPGTRLGAYELVALIGAGGMGEVYRARDTRLGREVAIKVLPADRIADADRRRRFVQEAQSASALNHPHIITIYEIESADDNDFIVMEYVRGKSLDALIPRQGMRLGEALRIGIAVADAVAAAHSRGIIHRDLKPANVIVGTDGAVKVLDFGLAKLMADSDTPEEDSPTLTSHALVSAPGTITGTAAYMAPEQATGRTVDARADIFSFGAMLYEMVTGQRAFAGTSTAETLSAVIRAQPKAPSAVIPGVPSDLEKVILRCLRKDPERRFQHIGDVKVALEDVKEESESGPAAAPAQRRRSRKVLGLGVLVVLGLGTLGLWRLWPSIPPALPAPALVTVTSMKGLEFHPTFSPDGEQIAFAWNGENENNWDIYLMLVGSSEVRRLTSDGGRDDVPTWSADGREIAFLRSSQNGSAVMAVSPVTGTERKLASVTAGRLVGLSWSPNGRWLAAAGTVTARGNGIYVIPSEGGEVRTLIRATPPEYYLAVAFSRDGRQLAAGVCTAAVRCNLTLADVNPEIGAAGAPRSLTRQAVAEVTAIAWSRDGKSVIYASHSRLWRVPADANAAPTPLDLAGIGAQTPAVASGRDRLAFTLERTNMSIHPLDTALASPPVLASSAWDFDVQFSPDGRRLAFTSTRLGDGAQIWTARADGSGARQLVQGRGKWQGSPAWSPDGRQIAFDYRQDNGSWSLFVVDADGGAPRQLTMDAGDENVPTWSRDGQWVYYTSDQKVGRNVWRIPAQGGRPQQITSTGSLYRAVPSPDGTEIFFQPRTGGPASSLAAPLLAVPKGGGSTPRQVLRCAADFATTVTGLYYVECGNTAEHNIRVVDAATKRDVVIGRTGFIDTELTSTLAVSPDGKTVLVPRQFHTADLMLIENFR
jgi:eukaryotic-like serine/threonine-protein kinase